MTAKKRVLFVDDEAPILAGLQDLLYRDRKRWDMVFALGGERALDELRARPVDVVVSDMRMPGIDGAALLNIVMVEAPGTARIVLSGHADRDAIVRALPSTHQFLSKPCDPNMLRAAIERCLDAMSKPRPDIRVLIGKLDKLPSPSSVYLELSKIVDDPATEIEDIERVVARDTALAAKVLQLANSAAFGLSRTITSIHQAVAYLGIELIRCLALTSFVLGDTTPSELAGFSLDGMQAKALRVATFARRIARNRADADIALAAGLLHDIGETVFAVGIPDAYARLHREAHAAEEPTLVAERRELGVTHAEAGAWLLGMWGLPPMLLELVARHHEPSLAPAPLHELVAVLHVADVLVGHVAAGEQTLDLASSTRSA